MSHIAKIELEINSLSDLKEACKELRFNFMENQKTFAWYGRWVGDSPLPEGMNIDDLGKCDHAIHVPGCDYEVGIIKRGNKYHLVYDYWYSGGLNVKLGKNAGKLKQAYTVARIKNESRKKGYKVRQCATDNSIRLVLTV